MTLFIQQLAFSRILTLAVFVVTCSMHLASPVDAQLGGCPCAVNQSMHRATQNHVSQATTSAAREIVGALRAQTRQTSQHLDRQTEAAERIADASSQNSAQLVRHQIRAKAESGDFDPNTDFCLVMDTALTPQLPSNADIPTATAAVRTAEEWSRGENYAVSENGLRMAAYLARERNEVLTAGGARDATTEWSAYFSKSTLNLDDELVRRALPRLISNTVDPFPPKPLSDEDLHSPTGLSEAVRRRATEARNQAAIAAIEFSLQLASPSIPADPYRTIAERTRYEGDIPDLISESQALEIRIAGYVMPNAATLEVRHSKTERALLQDLIDLTSLNTRIAYLRLQQESRSAILQAALLGLLTDGTTSDLGLP